ncbi:hypothetical protein FRZ06_13245 [Anoxybacterium hadale]|uniref:Uncharacterized protein n=1 Tax=Anoxybacterium hadale TaxID=3408580 RepID=A0ACD1ACW7_9FIRM|nr:hypothetical protein FRZ06_13245 [Clostridiales bacterium]
MKKSKCLLISAILGTLYLVYVISYFINGVASTSGSDQIGAGIATALVAPHMFLLALAVLFNWIGWAARVRWAALTGGILYCVSGLLFLLYVVFEIPSIILSFVGFAKMKKAKTKVQEVVSQE